MAGKLVTTCLLSVLKPSVCAESRNRARGARGVLFLSRIGGRAWADTLSIEAVRYSLSRVADAPRWVRSLKVQPVRYFLTEASAARGAAPKLAKSCHRGADHGVVRALPEDRKAGVQQLRCRREPCSVLPVPHRMVLLRQVPKGTSGTDSKHAPQLSCGRVVSPSC